MIKYIYSILYSFVVWFAIKIIKCGPIPKHIAIIMDGNRRWAEKHNMKKTEGHFHGYQKLEEVIV